MVLYRVIAETLMVAVSRFTAPIVPKEVCSHFDFQKPSKLEIFLASTLTNQHQQETLEMGKFVKVMDILKFIIIFHDGQFATIIG